jgi:tRNA modification GTPase
MIMSDQSTSHVILLTPMGRGALASILVEGAGAASRLEPRFKAASGLALGDLPVGRLQYGQWKVTDTCAEQVVVCRRAADQVEIHCHGGQVAATTILDSLTELGFRQLDWSSWLRRRCDDPIRAEARIALSAAATERTALHLLDQYHGALRASIEGILQLLRQSELTIAGERLGELLQWSSVGLHLTRPWKVVLAGPANAGKSSLINAILGYRRALVYDASGTTRDVLTAITAIDGWPVELADTAGLESSSNAVQGAGLAQARRQLQIADLVVLVFDVTRPWGGVESDLLSMQTDAVIVHNKSDLAGPREGICPTALRTSAHTGEGIPALMDQIAIRLVPTTPPAGTPMPFTAAQMGTLAHARDQLAAGDLQAAAESLLAMLSPAEASPPHTPATA